MIDKINVQFVTDEDGNKKSVLIPYKDWQKLQKELKELLEYRSMKDNLSTSFLQMKDIQSGKLPRKSLSSFLDEC